MENHDVTGEGGSIVEPPVTNGPMMGNTPASVKTGKGLPAASQDSDSGTDVNEDATSGHDDDKTSDKTEQGQETSEQPPSRLQTDDTDTEKSPEPESFSETLQAAAATGVSGLPEDEVPSPEPEVDTKDTVVPEVESPGTSDTPSQMDATEPETTEKKGESAAVVEDNASSAEATTPVTTAGPTTEPASGATETEATAAKPAVDTAAVPASSDPPTTTATTSTTTSETLTASSFQAAGMDPGMVQLLKQMHPDIFVQMEAYTRLVSHVNSLGFSFRSNVPMDGNCMFHVVVDQLQRTQGPVMSHQELRSKAVEYLREHPFTEGNQHLRSFVPDEKWDSYLTAMSRDGEWGDHIALMALASVLRREIHVVSSTPGDDFLTKIKPNGGTESPVSGPPLLLGHYAEQHYVSLDGPQRPGRQLSRQLSIEAPPSRGQQEAKGMTFHDVHGSAVMLSSDKRSAQRLSVSGERTPSSALVFSSAPIKVNHEVFVEFSGFTDKGSGALFFGVTTVDPATWNPAELPVSLTVDRHNIEGFWVWPIDHDLMTTGALFKFSVNCNGNLEYSSNVNGGRSKLQLASIPADQPMWAVLDLQGRTQTVKFVDGEDQKKARVIWQKGKTPDCPPDINVVMGFLQGLLMDKIQILKSCATVIREEETPQLARRTLTYLRALTMNVVEKGDEEEHRKVNILNTEFKETILRSHSAQQFMVAAGWCQVDNMMVFTRTCDVLLQPTMEAIDECLNALPESFAETDMAGGLPTTDQADDAVAEEPHLTEEESNLQNKIQVISSCAAIIKEEEKTEITRNALTTVRRMTSNIMEHPDDEKYRTVRVANKKFQNTIMVSTNAQQLVLAAGWEQVEDAMVFNKSKDELLKPTLQIIDDLLGSLPSETSDDREEQARQDFVPTTAVGPFTTESFKLPRGLPSGVEASRGMRFHVIRGSNVALAPDRKVAHRKGGISNAITFSGRPFDVNQMIAVQIHDRDAAIDSALVLGVTTVDPIKWDTDNLPLFLSHLSNDVDCWSEPIGDDVALTGNTLTFYVSNLGSLKCSVYAAHTDQLVEEIDIGCNIPTDKPLWAVLDLFGSTTGVRFVEIEEKQEPDEEVPFLSQKDRSYVSSLLSNIVENLPPTTEEVDHEATGKSSPSSTRDLFGEKVEPGKPVFTVPASDVSAHSQEETEDDTLSTEDLPRVNWLTPLVNELLGKETVKQAKLTLTTLWTMTNNVINYKGNDDKNRKMSSKDIPFADAIMASQTAYQLFQKIGWRKLGDTLIYPQYGGPKLGPVLVAFEEGLCNLEKDEPPAAEKKPEASEDLEGNINLTIKACVEEIEEKETTGQARITLSTIRDVARRVRDNPGDNKFRRVNMKEGVYADAIMRSEAPKNLMLTTGWIQVGDMLIFPKCCDKRLDFILTATEESLSKLPDHHLTSTEEERSKMETVPQEEEKEHGKDEVSEENIVPKFQKPAEEEKTEKKQAGCATGHGTKKQRLAFNTVHGSELQLKDGGRTMRRLYAPDDDTSAITFSNRPIDIGEKVSIEISEYRPKYSEDGRGVLILGLTTEDPSTMTQDDLPACIIDLTAQDNYWARRIKAKFVGSGDTLTFYLDKDGNLTYTFRDVEDEVHLCDIPTDEPLWAILDMDGGATSLTFKDDQVEEPTFKMPWETWDVTPDSADPLTETTSHLADQTPEAAGHKTKEATSAPTPDADSMTEEEKLAFAFQKFKQQVEDPAKEPPPEELITLINAIRQRNEDDDSSDSEDEEGESNVASELLGKLGSALFETVLRSELQHLFDKSGSASGESKDDEEGGLAAAEASFEDKVQIVKSCIETMEEEEGTERATASLSLIKKITSNIVNNPGDPKYRQLRIKNKSVSGDIMDVPTAVQLLVAIGWVQSDNSFVLPTSADDLLEPTLKAVDECLRKLKGEETPSGSSEDEKPTQAGEAASTAPDGRSEEVKTTLAGEDTRTAPDGHSEEVKTIAAGEEPTTSRPFPKAPDGRSGEVKATLAAAEAVPSTSHRETPTYSSEVMTATTTEEEVVTDAAHGPIDEVLQEQEVGLEALRSRTAELLTEETPQQAWMILTVVEKMLRDKITNPKKETSRHVRHLLPESALGLLVAAGCVQVENMVIFPTEIKVLQDALEVVVEAHRTLTETKPDSREEPGMFVAGTVKAEEEVQQTSYSAPHEASAVTEAMCFNSIHGSAVLLTKDRTVARLLLDTSKTGSGIVFSDKPIAVEEKVSIELTEYWYDRKGSNKGDLVLGVTTVDPFMLDDDKLPQSAIPDLTNRDGYWAIRIRRHRIVPGDVLTAYVSSTGNLIYAVNEEEKGVLIYDLPTDQPLWVMMDMDGGVTALTLVQKDDKDSEEPPSPLCEEKEEQPVGTPPPPPSLHVSTPPVEDDDLYDSVRDIPVPGAFMTPQAEEPEAPEATSAPPTDAEEKPSGSPEETEVDLNSMTKEERMDYIMKMQGEEFSLEEKTGLLKACVDVIKEDETMEQAKTSLKYLLNRMSNLANNPDDERYRQVYIRSGTFWEAMRPRSAQQFMVAAGWVQVGDNMVFPSYYDALIQPALDALNNCLSTFPMEPISLYGRKDPVGDPEGLPDTTKITGMTFHDVHGNAVELSEDGRTAKHLDDSTDTSSTIAFSSRQVNASDEVYVQVKDPVSGTFLVGITTLDPSTLNLDDLPKQAADLKSLDGFWIWPLEDVLTDAGSVLKLSVSCTGNLTYSVGDKHHGGFISNIPTDKPLWVILVLQGWVGGITFVDEDEVASSTTVKDEEETGAYPWSTDEDDLYSMEPDLPSYGVTPETRGTSPDDEDLYKTSPQDKEASIREKIQVLDACADVIKEEASSDKARLALSYIRAQTRKILNRPSSDENRTIPLRDRMFLVAVSASTEAVIQFMVAAGWILRKEQEKMTFPRANDSLLEPTLTSIDACLRTIPGGYLDVTRLEDQLEDLEDGIEELHGVEFHTVHGTNIELSEDKRTARRIGELSKAIVFTSTSFGTNKRVSVQFAECDPDTKTAAMFGVTTQNPLLWKPAELPMFGTDLSKQDGYWLEPLGEDVATEGSVLTFHVDSSGSLVYSLKNADDEETMKDVEVFNDVPTDKPLWAVLDLFGSTKAVQLLDREQAEDDASGPGIDSTFQLPGSGFQSTMGDSFQLPSGPSFPASKDTGFKSPMGATFQPPAGTSFQPATSTSFQQPMGTGFQPPMSTSFQPPMSNGESPMGSVSQPSTYSGFETTSFNSFTPSTNGDFPLDLD